MKKLSFLLLTLITMSCTDKGDDENLTSDVSLEGEWTLTQVSCYCFFKPETDFSQTKIVFDSNNDKLTVTQNGENEFFKKSGVYNYAGSGNRFSFMDDSSYYNFEINGTTLIITYEDEPEIADDEVSYSFKR